MQKFTVTLQKTIYVQVTAENMYDMMEQLENHAYCKEQGYIIKTAHLREDEEVEADPKAEEDYPYCPSCKDSGLGQQEGFRCAYCAGGGKC